MKVGVFLTNQHPPGSDMVSALEDQCVMTRLARDRGWDAVATGQHYLSEGVSQLQLVPFLARLAAEAGHLTGIAGIHLAGLHNPVEVAECIASLDVIWRGNFVRRSSAPGTRARRWGMAGPFLAQEYRTSLWLHVLSAPILASLLRPMKRRSCSGPPHPPSAQSHFDGALGDLPVGLTAQAFAM